MSENIIIHYKNANGTDDKIYPQTTCINTDFNPDNNIKNSTTQYNSIHNPLYATNIQSALEELDQNISAHGRKFHKLKIPPYISPNDSKMVTSLNGDRIFIVDKNLGILYFSLQNGNADTWFARKLYPNAYGEVKDILYDENAGQLWILQSKYLFLMSNLFSNPLTQNYKIPTTVVSSEGAKVFGLYTTGYTGYMIIGGYATVGQPTTQIIQFTNSTTGRNALESGSNWNTHISRSRPNDEATNIVCNPNGYAVISVDTDISDTGYLYTYNFSNSDLEQKIPSYIIKEIIVGGENQRNNVVIFENKSGVAYQDLQSGTTWTNIIWTNFSFNDGATAFSIGQMFYINGHWCLQFNANDVSTNKSYVSISNLANSISDITTWNTKLLYDLMPSEYSNILNNADFSVVEYNNIDLQNILSCCGISKNSDISYSVWTSSGMSVGIDESCNIVENSVKIIDTVYSAYLKIIKGYKNTYLALSCNSIVVDDTMYTSSVIAHSLDGTTWISCELSNTVKITDLFYINDFYFWCGIETSLYEPIIVRKQISTGEVFDYIDTAERGYTDIQAYGQIASNYKSIVFAFTNNFTTKNPDNTFGNGDNTSNIYYIENLTTDTIVQSTNYKFGGINGILSTNCGYVFGFLNIDAISSDPVLGAVQNYFKIYVMQSYFKTTETYKGRSNGSYFLRIIGRSLQNGKLYAVGSSGLMYSVNNGLNWIDAGVTKAWNWNSYQAPVVDPNGYYFAIQDTTGVLTYSSYSIDEDTKLGTVSIENDDISYNIHTMLYIDNKIFILTGKNARLQAPSRTSDVGAVYYSLTT